MTRIIVLLNLKPGKSATDYEKWALSTDLPTASALESVNRFSLFAATEVMGGGTSPYQYIEVIDVADMDQFGQEIRTEAMGRIAAEFQGWADPIFIVTREVAATA